MILEIDGEEIEVDDADIPELLAQLRKESEPDYTKLASAISEAVTKALIPVVKSIGAPKVEVNLDKVVKDSIMAALGGIKIPEIPKPESPESVKKIKLHNIAYDRAQMIKSCDLELIR